MSSRVRLSLMDRMLWQTQEKIWDRSMRRSFSKEGRIRARNPHRLQADCGGAGRAARAEGAHLPGMPNPFRSAGTYADRRAGESTGWSWAGALHPDAIVVVPDDIFGGLIRQGIAAPRRIDDIAGKTAALKVRACTWSSSRCRDDSLYGKGCARSANATARDGDSATGGDRLSKGGRRCRQGPGRARQQATVA